MIEEIQYCKEVNFLKEVINSVLLDIGVPNIDNNKDFYINQHWHHTCYVKYFINKIKCIKIEFDLCKSGLAISIDEMEEAYDYDYDFVVKNKLFVQETIKIILTAIPHVKSCFPSYKKIEFKDSNNNILREYSLSRSLFSFLKLNCKEEIYSKIYDYEGSMENIISTYTSRYLKIP